MEFSIKAGSLEKLRSDCVVVGVYEGGQATEACSVLDRVSGGVIGKILEQGDFPGKAGTTLLLSHVAGLAAKRVLLVGLGKEDDFSDLAYCKAVAAAVSAMGDLDVKKAVLALIDLSVAQKGVAWKARQTVVSSEEAVYRFDRYKTTGKDKGVVLSHLTLICEDIAEAERGVEAGKAVAAGMNFARDLANAPGNVCTPTYLAEEAEAMAKAAGLACEVLKRKEIEKLGMGSFLAVAKGSEQEPRFVVVRHQGAKKGDKPVVLVGKGITFDSGGISLKPPQDMDEMKFDMSGAATVLGAMKAVAALRLPLNVVALVPTCENMPGGRANKPGDILTSMSGQTIEVLNTDAEGRLILADALTYAERLEPQAVVDVATLTGACVIALGAHATGLLANDDALAQELLAAGREACDRAWQLPLWEDYQEQLKSTVADMANIGGRAGGTITAACFLSRFAKAYSWAHLDVAGTAHRSGKEKSSTGRPVPLLVQFLAERAGVKGAK